MWSQFQPLNLDKEFLNWIFGYSTSINVIMTNMKSSQIIHIKAKISLGMARYQSEVEQV